jgi:hypothetical protein
MQASVTEIKNPYSKHDDALAQPTRNLAEARKGACHISLFESRSSFRPDVREVWEFGGKLASNELAKFWTGCAHNGTVILHNMLPSQVR